MKKQLVTSVDVAGVPRGFDGLMEHTYQNDEYI